MGGFFQTLHDAFTGGGEVGRIRDLAKQNEDIGLANAQREQHLKDIEFHDSIQHLTNPVVNGMVKRPYYNPGDPSAVGKSNIPGVADGPSAIPEIAGHVLDKAGADGRQVVNFKDSQGQPVSYEIMSPEDQIAQQRILRTQALQANQTPAAMEDQQKFQANRLSAKGTSQGAGEGKTSAEQADLAARGVDITPEEADAAGFPKGMKRILPEQFIGLQGKIMPAKIRQDTAITTTGMRDDTSTGNTKTRVDAAQQRQVSNQSFRDFEAQRNQGVQQAMNAQRVAVQAGINPNLAPMKLKQYDSSVAQYGQLAQQSKELHDNYAATQELLDPQQTPDNQLFINPWTGTQQTMNGITRRALATKAQAAQQQYSTIEQQRQGMEKANNWTPQQGQAGAGGAPQQQQGGAPAPQQPQQGGAPVAAPQRGGAQPAPGQPQAPRVADPVAEAIANYNTAPPRAPAVGSMKGVAAYTGMMKRILAVNPQYDQTEYANKLNTQKSFGGGGKDAQSALALNTLVRHSDDLLGAIDQLGNSNFRPANTAVQHLKEIFGSAVPTNFDQLKSYVAGETVKLISSGGGTEGEQKAAEERISRSASTDQLKGAVQTNFSVAGGKMQALNEKAKKGHLGADYNVLDEGAADIMKRRGYDPATLKPVAQQQQSLPAAAKSQLKEGYETTFRNGQVWTLKGGKETRVK